MSDFIKLNGRRIPAANADFNFVAYLEENNIPLTDIQKKPLSTAKVYVAYCLGADTDYAGQLINDHIIGGGDIADVMDMITKKVDESDFFRALQERTAESVDQGESETKVTKMTRKKTSDPQG